MRGVAIRFADSALEDIESIRDFCGRQGVPEVGERIVRRLIERIETLGDHPDMGRIVPEFQQASLRELLHPPFRLVYRREAEQVRMVRVWRSERWLELPDDEESM